MISPFSPYGGLEKKGDKMKIALIVYGLIVGYIMLYFLGKAIESEPDEQIERDNVRERLWNTFDNTPSRDDEVLNKRRDQ